MEIALFIAVLGAVLLIAHFAGGKARAKRRAVLAEAANGFMVEGQLDPAKPVVSGRVDGVELSFRLVTRGAGSSAESWTECEVCVGTDELLIALRPQSHGEERWVDKGLARDVVIGDPGFDDKFIVEAAPAELAARALGAELRAALLSHHPMAVKPCKAGLLLEKRGWIEQPEAIRAFAAMGARLATGMQAATQAAEARGRRQAALTGYRGSAEGAVPRQEARAQVAELQAMRARRTEVQKLRNALLLAAMLGLMVLVALVGQC